MRALAPLAAAAALTVLGLGAPRAHAAPAAPAAMSPFHAALSAANENPKGPKDSNGQYATGTAKLEIDRATGQLCSTLDWSPGVGTPDAAHIHRGDAGTDGPIVVVLQPTKARTCQGVPGAVLSGIVANPNGYYVNVHNTPAGYPNGAVRGQIAAG